MEWYNDKNWSGAADNVPVVIREETANINAQLGYGGTISGTVTDAVSGLPIANVTVSARDEANIAINSRVTNADGQYTIYRVPACNVKLYFNAGTTGYVSEWYNDKASFATADLVPVTADQECHRHQCPVGRNPDHHRHLAQRRRDLDGGTDPSHQLDFDRHYG